MNFAEFDSPEWKLLTQVSRPSRYSGSEWRPHKKLNWEDSRLKICLAFPDVYEIGMSYYGFQIIESFINSLNKNFLADRVYCAWPDMEKLMIESNTPLISIEQRRKIKDFDVLAFTMPHEASYTNILTILNLSGLKLKSVDRDNDSPLVIAGGYGAYNPEVMSDFIDLFCVGEAEAILPSLLNSIESAKNLSRYDKIRELAKLPGIYAPLFPDKVTRQITRNLYTLKSMIVPSVNIVHDRAAIELFRGCGRGCRFCQAGMVNRPVRERNLDEAAQSIRDIIKSTGWEEIGLLSLASCDYSGIENLIDLLTPELNSRHSKLSLPSLRMDGFSIGLAEKLEGIRSRHGSITFAPEAGTQRLRDVINKGINEEMIINCLREIFSRGWERVKLYFMMGLPTERDEDLRAIAELSQEALKLARSMGKRRVTVSASVSGFVPKAHTPFQWEEQDSIQELREKGRFIKSLIHDRALSIAYHEPEQTFLEGVLSRGDKLTGRVILRAWEMGARFDNWTEYFDLTRDKLDVVLDWLACGINPDNYTRERKEDEILSWDFVNVGLTKEFLLRERHKAYSGKLTQDCITGCAGCGLNCKQ